MNHVIYNVMDITKLKGIGDGTAKKFEKNGITTVEQLFVIPPPKVAEMLGIDNDSAVELFKRQDQFMMIHLFFNQD